MTKLETFKKLKAEVVEKLDNLEVVLGEINESTTLEDTDLRELNKELFLVMGKVLELSANVANKLNVRDSGDSK